jgi:BirA family transcriptional regulator, biotin operon repressor / biotin---[acetyl-CoA-carboxylase] ligase
MMSLFRLSWAGLAARRCGLILIKIFTCCVALSAYGPTVKFQDFEYPLRKGKTLYVYRVFQRKNRAMNTLFVGKVLHRFDELPSTNDYALDLVAKSSNSLAQWPAEGAVVWADKQSAGRGQFGSQWLAEPGQNLTVSILLYPRWLPLARQFELSMAVALGLLDTVQALCPALKSGWHIKWPNDLYFQEKKVAGILIQNSVQGQGIQAAIVGIGLNVNQKTFDPTLPNPSSLYLSTGESFDLGHVLKWLCFYIEKRYLQLRAGKSDFIRENYTAQLFGLGKTLSFVLAATGDVFEGSVHGVDDKGWLLVARGDKVQAFDLKEISIVFS